MITFDELLTYKNKSLGSSDWVLIDQDRVNAFADCTEDHFFIHVDPEQAAHSPLGGTIAHGLLTLSLAAPLAREVEPQVKGLAMGFNYGYDNLRFLTPVRVGKRIRTRVELIQVTKKGDKKYLLEYKIKVEIEDEDKPALICTWMAMMVSE